MPTAGKLLLVALLVAFLVGTGLLLFGGPGAVPGQIGPTAQGGVESSQPLRAEDRDAAPAPATERTAVAAAAAVPEDDPEIRAALAGFKGRLVHHDDSPAGGLRVVLYRVDVDVFGDVGDLLGEQAIDVDLEAGAATARDDGRFLIEGVWPRGMYLLHAGIGSQWSTSLIVERTPGAGEVVDLGDIRVTPGGVLTGTVLDDAGEPAAGALVRAIDLPAAIMSMVPLERFDPDGAIIVQDHGRGMVFDMPGWAGRLFERLPVPTTRTTADGRFRLVAVPPDTAHSLVVTAAEHTALFRAGVRLRPGEERDLGTLRMRAGEEVYGRVTERGGKPVPGAEVHVGQGGPMGEVYFAPAAVTTDAQGSFALGGFKNGRVVAAARRGPGHPWTFTAPQSVVRDVVIELPAALTLTVAVSGPGGAVIDDPTFRLLPGRHGDGALEAAAFGMSAGIDLAARQRRRADGKHEITGLVPGHYTLLTRAPGHALALDRIELRTDAQVVVELVRDAALLVSVADEAGRPVRSATVFVMIRGRQRVREMPAPAGKTGSDGRALVDGLPPGKVRVTARHPKYGSVHAAADVPGAELALVMRTPGRLEGVLTEAGARPTPGKWMLMVEERHEGPRGAVPQLPRLAVADAEGKFSVESLQPGRYRVAVRDSISTWTTLGTVVQGFIAQERISSRNPVVFDIEPGKTTQVAIDTALQPAVVEGPSARISGSVMVDGRPGAGMVLSGWSGRRLAVTVDAAGRFDFGQVKAGRVQLELRDPRRDLFRESEPWTKIVDVVAGEDVVLDIVMETGTISGTVLAPDGTPVPGTRVRFTGQRPGERAAFTRLQTVTDERGNFSLDRVPTGTYAVAAEEPDAVGVARVEGIVVQPGLRVAGVELRMRPTVTLAGRIDLRVLGNQKPDYLWLTFRREAKDQPTHRRWTRAAADGSFEVRGMLPGSYRLDAWVRIEGSNESRNYRNKSPIDVSDRDTRDVVIELEKS